MATMLATLERMGNQLPPRLKAVLNLAITIVLVFLAIPLTWIGVTSSDWGQAALGVGLLMLGIFNLFT